MKALQLDPEQLKAVYNQEHSLERTARVLHIDPLTVLRYMVKYGIKRQPPGRPPVPFSKHYGCIIKWIRQYPEIKFPRSIKGIAELTGCTQDSVKTYLYRKRKAVKTKVHKLPDLRTINLTLRSTKKTLIPTRAFKQYSIFVNPWTLKVRLEADLKTGPHYRFIFNTVEDIK